MWTEAEGSSRQRPGPGRRCVCRCRPLLWNRVTGLPSSVQPWRLDGWCRRAPGRRHRQPDKAKWMVYTVFRPPTRQQMFAMEQPIRPSARGVRLTNDKSPTTRRLAACLLTCYCVIHENIVFVGRLPCATVIIVFLPTRSKRESRSPSLHRNSD